MKSKKGQGELITTVLIILVVLAAVAIVATFIIRNVTKTTETAGNKTEALTGQLGGSADCSQITLNISSATASNGAVVVTQPSGTLTASNVKFIVGGTVCTTTPATQPLAPGASATYTISGCGTLTAGTTKVQAAAVTSGGTVCSATSTATFA